MNEIDSVEFRNTQPVNPPQILSEQIFSRVRRDLNPSIWKVFSKLSLIHFFTALATLSICPQFGVRLLGEGVGLMTYFMQFGAYGCMLACGSFFVGSSVLVAMIILRSEEIRVIRNHRILELGALSLLSLGFFIMLQAKMILGIFFAWAVGSFVGGILMLELGWNIRYRLIKPL